MLWKTKSLVGVVLGKIVSGVLPKKAKVWLPSSLKS
jgi:hypothetical protein